jgi:hypothetical protein
MHEQLDRETLKLLEKQHRRRALNLRGCLVRVLVLDGLNVVRSFFGVLQGFGPDDDGFHISGGHPELIAFDQVVDIRLEGVQL